MSTAASPEPLPEPPAPGPRCPPQEDPEFLRARSGAGDLRQDFNLMEQKKRVTMILQSPSFREELESLIQEQMKKGNNSSHVWALRQIADFMATTSPAALPTSPMGLASVTPINDLHGTEGPALAKGERLMRCKVGSIHRLLDLYGWAQLGHAAVTLRVSKEQEHFLVAPQGLACSEVTAASLVKVNVLGAVVEQGSTSFAPDARSFSLHAAIYAARPDIRCIVRLHTPAAAAVSAMRCGLLPISRAALLLGDVAYFDFRGEVEDEADRVELQKCLGPTCKILVLRNHGVLALGDTAEEAFYSIFHLQAACEVQVSALASAGGAENLIVLERAQQRVPHGLGAVRRAGTTFGPLHKSRLGEHEFEALMRMLDNLGYRTGYTYRYPFVQEKSKPKSDVLIPATVTAFVFEEEPAGTPALRQHAQKQQKEKTRWLNTPNTYTRVNLAEEQQGTAGGQRTKTTWLRADEVEKGSSGTPIRIENPNQFVPLYTDPQEVLEMRNKSTESHLGDAEAKEGREEAPPEPEPPNPFSQLTDQELEEYKQEVERKKRLQGERDAAAEESEAPPTEALPPEPPAPTEPTEGDKKADGGQAPPDSTAKKEPPAVVNGKDEEQSTEENLGKGGTDRTTTNADQDAPKEKETVTSNPVSPDGSPSKSPSKKKKKFRTPSFLKKGKKKEKIES
ncbi:beta-adducin isoform X2 [Poecile atricapillus]|uniref:beta-adducin isoform X2 n=1 Tax=Poecile atricapillus TaxID=48891 RepID=UPI00273A27EE|nr:beta-adducin isoform X2 [Poecile atricapillus]